MRAPSDDGGVLAVPDIADWPALVAANRDALADPLRHARFGGLPFAEFRRLARRDVAAAAAAHHARFGLSAPEPSTALDTPWIGGGHQPELFHPGVWVKNFAVDRLAAAVQGVGVHVVVDNDAAKHAAIRVPAGTPSAPLSAFVPFDEGDADRPYEEWFVRNEAVFRRFPDAVAAAMKNHPFRPLVEDSWPAALEAGRTTVNVGERLSVARRKLEENWGVRSLEAPLSALCHSESFRRTAAVLLLDAPGFAAAYNTALAAYRVLHRVKSKNHPVPALAVDGDWCEGPFWAWSSASPRRRHVWVRR
ncbi:MAG: hypothetical protein ACRDD1_04395, partial [Planctomycetia bacterium]